MKPGLISPSNPLKCRNFHVDNIIPRPVMDKLIFVRAVDVFRQSIAIGGAVAKLGGEQRRLSFSFPDGRCVWAFSGRLEDPVDDHRVRVRLPVGKHRAFPFPQ